MHNITLSIPEELIEQKSDSVNFDLLKNKHIISLMGYSKCGKDLIGKELVKNYGFTRVAFGDVMKRDMNLYLKDKIKVDLESSNIDLGIDDIDFLNPKTQEIKEILRPYMIWFGQEIRKMNGQHHWTNRAFSQLQLKSIRTNKIVITDIRRECELDIFTNASIKPLLIHVSQYGLTDSDELTLEAIRKAQEMWLFGHTILVDSRIPNTSDLRKTHIECHVNDLSKKFPEYFVERNV